MTSPDLDPYLRIVLLFDQDPTAARFLNENGEGGFSGAVFRMAREIDRLNAEIVPAGNFPLPQNAAEAEAMQKIVPAGNFPLPQNAAEAEAMQKIGFEWLKAHAPDRLTDEGLASPTPAIVRHEVFTALSDSDYQLLCRFERDQLAGGWRYVVEDDAELLRQGARLSEAGLIFIEQQPRGGIFHITRLGMKALAGFRNSPTAQTSTNPQHNHFTERYDGID